MSLCYEVVATKDGNLFCTQVFTKKDEKTTFSKIKNSYP